MLFCCFNHHFSLRNFFCREVVIFLCNIRQKTPRTRYPAKKRTKVKPITKYLFKELRYDYQSNRRTKNQGSGEQNCRRGTSVIISQRIATLAGSEKCGKGVRGWRKKLTARTLLFPYYCFAVSRLSFVADFASLSGRVCAMIFSFACNIWTETPDLCLENREKQ